MAGLIYKRYLASVSALFFSLKARAGECVYDASAGEYYYSAGVEMAIAFLVVGWLLSTSWKEWASENTYLAVGVLFGVPVLVNLMARTGVSC